MSLDRQLALPPEILEMILDSISLKSKDGRQALSNCLLVSRMFFWRSRTRLFSHVVLRTYDPSRSEGLRKLLEYQGGISGYPDLIRCIKSFKTESVSLQEETSGDNNDVAAILSMLASTGILRALHLQSSRRTGFSLITAGKEAVRAVHKICHSPTFEELKLTKIHAVHFDLCDLWTINKFSVKPNTTFLYIDSSSNTTGLTDQPIVTQPRLRTFDFTFKSRQMLPIEWFSTPSPFSCLDNLTVGFDYMLPPEPEVTSQLNTILDVSAATLQTLTIRLDDPQHRMFNDYSLSLPNLSALRKLRFHIPGYSPGLGFIRGHRLGRVLGGSQDVQETLKSFEQVPETLDQIVVLYDIFIQAGVDFRFKSDLDWQTLGDLLVSKQFDSVRRVEVVLLAKFKRVDFGLVESPPFLEDFPAIWKSRYPRIPFIIHKIDEDDEELYNQIIS